MVQLEDIDGTTAFLTIPVRGLLCSTSKLKTWRQKNTPRCVCESKTYKMFLSNTSNITVYVTMTEQVNGKDLGLSSTGRSLVVSSLELKQL